MNVWIRERSAGASDSPARSMSAGLHRARGRDDWLSDLGGNEADRVRVIVGRDGKTRFKDVDPEHFELAGQLELLRRVHGEPGRLLAIPERRVKDCQLFGCHGCLLHATTWPGVLLTVNVVLNRSQSYKYYDYISYHYAVDLSELRVFLTVATERSFSRAAAKLHRTQPAVGQAVKRLEEELGERLFDRSSKGGN